MDTEAPLEDSPIPAWSKISPAPEESLLPLLTKIDPELEDEAPETNSTDPLERKSEDVLRETLEVASMEAVYAVATNEESLFTKIEPESLFIDANPL